MERVFGDGGTSSLVARLLKGEGMSAVCREFGISRKTGYKIWGRYRQEGLEALCDRSRWPVRYANQLPEPMERLIVEGSTGCGPISARTYSRERRVPRAGPAEPARMTPGQGMPSLA